MPPWVLGPKPCRGNLAMSQGEHDLMAPNFVYPGDQGFFLAFFRVSGAGGGGGGEKPVAPSVKFVLLLMKYILYSLYR